jgi:hypothetical protein
LFNYIRQDMTIEATQGSLLTFFVAMGDPFVPVTFSFVGSYIQAGQRSKYHGGQQAVI